MKRFFIYKFIVLTFAVLAYLGANSANGITVPSTKDVGTEHLKVTNSYKGIVTDAKHNPFPHMQHHVSLPISAERSIQAIESSKEKSPSTTKAPSKAAEEVINLSFHAIMDEEGLILPNAILLVNAEHDYLGYFGEWPDDLPDDEWDTFEPDYSLANLSVTPGTYDMMYEFWNNGDGPVIGRVIKENVIIESSQTDITCDYKEATRTISFRPVLPNGNEMTLYTYRWLTQEPWYEVEVEGNIYDQYTVASIISKDYGTIATFFGNCGANDTEYEGDRLETFDFLINPGISNRYVFRKLLCIPLPNGDELDLLMSTEGADTNLVTCDPMDYQLVEHEFVHTPAFGTYDLNTDFGATTEVGVMDYGLEQGGFSGSRSADSKTYTLVNIPYPVEQMAMYSSYQLNDFTKSYTIDWGDGETEEYYSYFGTCSPKYLHNGEKSVYYYGPQSMYVPSIDFEFVHYPCMDDFTFMPSESNIKIGESPALFTVYYASYDGWWDDKVHRVEADVTYSGYLGEKRYADLGLAEFSAKFNGEDFLNPNYDWDTALYLWSLGYPEAGVIELEFKNDNVEVDGLPGHNYAKLTANYRNEDDNVPVIQALTMRNTKDNQIDCRFENPEDGKIIFTGADFNINIELDGYYLNTWMDEEPMNVVVEYAPYGTGDWEELPYAIYEEKHKDCWGSFYSTPLAHVNRQSETGWFDLRLSLTDEAGNSNVQEISPAFRIASLATSGVKAINTDSSEAIYYTIDGRRAYGTLTPGIYVKITDGKAQKVTIK